MKLSSQNGNLTKNECMSVFITKTSRFRDLVADYIATTVDYTILALDDVIGVTNTSVPRTVTLPPIANVQVGRKFEIKDISGAAGTNNITVDANGSETIDGSLTSVINNNYGSLVIMNNGTSWSIL